jgi:hypothetical protein
VNQREGKNKKENRKKGNRARQRILLTEAEVRRVDFAVGDSGALSRKRKIETFLNSDSKVKLEKIIENAIRELAISRRDRLTSQTQANLMTELREAVLRGLGNAGEPTR